MVIIAPFQDLVHEARDVGQVRCGGDASEQSLPTHQPDGVGIPDLPLRRRAKGTGKSV